VAIKGFRHKGLERFFATGTKLYELRGPRKGTWAVKVSGNWRITFTCAWEDVDRVDYEDYH